MKVTAIVPAFNEERTIGRVISTIKEVDNIEEIIVVSDGSTDSTAEIARSHDVTVIELKENVGKGGAMTYGFNYSKSPILLFLDADLIGLTKDHIRLLINPLINSKIDMTIGIFSKGRIITDVAQKIAPYLSGQRAIRREVFEKVCGIEIARYGVEVALTKSIDKLNIRTEHIVLQDITHVMKEEKLGLVRGFKARMRMYWDIVKCIKMEK